jgi:Flp pilus assembly protein TadG
MASFAFLTRWSPRLSSLRDDQRGAAAIEFAVVGMLMVTLWISCVEVAGGVSLQRKVTLAAHTVADLATRFESLNNEDMQAVLKAAPAILYPTGEGALEVTVSAVSIDKDGNAKVAWSEPYKKDAKGQSTQANCPKHGTDSVVALPADVLKVPNSQLIWGEVCYVYTPGLGGFVINELKLYDRTFMRPRRSEQVKRITS